MLFFVSTEFYDGMEAETRGNYLIERGVHFTHRFYNQDDNSLNVEKEHTQ